MNTMITIRANNGSARVIKRPGFSRMSTEAILKEGAHFVKPAAGFQNLD